MSKFVFLYGGQSEPSDDAMAEWLAWFDSIGSSVVDSGNPFAGGREVAGGTGTDLTEAMAPATGYSIVNADSIDAAVKLLEGCPSPVTRVYEAIPM